MAGTVQVEGRRVDGIVLTRIRQDDDRVHYLLEKRFPFVTFGRTPMSDRHPWLDVDAHAAALAAMRRLIGFGHKHIDHIGAPAQFTERTISRRKKIRQSRGTREIGMARKPAARSRKDSPAA